jgi:orotidine-5'-phosphate decarboxylase
VPSFGAGLATTFETSGHLCLGIDPHPFLLDQWGMPDTPAGVREFSLRAVEASVGAVGIVKPQVAFFERHGSAGYAALETVLAEARGAGLLVIADAKRGDVGSTVAAYGSSWLLAGSPLEADAMTVSAYQGVGSLREVVELALTNDKGLFILAATSNPESVETQTAVRASGATVAAGIVDEVHHLNSSAETLGSVGVVIGATISASDYGISFESLRSTPILAPGFGEQGAALADVTRLYGAAAPQVIANVGRGVLRVGMTGVRDELLRQAEELRSALAR